MESKQKKNICFILGSIDSIGGTGRAVSILMNELQKTNQYNIKLVSYHQKTKKSYYPLDSGIDIDIALDRPMSMRKGIIALVIYLVKYILKNRVDTIIACGVLQFPAAIVAAKITGCHVVCSEHSNYTCVSDAKFERESRNFAAKYSDDLITLTKKDTENYKTNTLVKANIDFIPNIVDEKLFQSNYSYNLQSKKIISVGRLTYAKNYELLIEIAGKILPKYPDWSWDIYGSGDLHDELQCRINNLKVERLTLKGNASNIYDLYHEYAFLVMTSRYEGYPMVLLEAMANGIPTIAFDCQTGPSDIINHNETGLLISENDSRKMIQSIESMISEESIRSEMSKNCQFSIHKFSTEEIITKWRKYLD